LRATLMTDKGDVTIFVVHTVAPVDSGGVATWEGELRELRESLRQVTGPLVVVGDFNATSGNRQFVAIQHDAKIRDVLDATGSGYAMTWPANRAFPPVVRPDHVLVGRGIVPLGGHTFGIPGSDHRGVVSDVGVTRPS
jgi:endonuclease/exonuclease/phosphatase (EEP) superfamily protein YafD